MTFGKRIKDRRQELGLSVEDIAIKLNKNKATIYRYESDEIGNMPIDIIQALAKALETTPAHLMGWDELIQDSPAALTGSLLGKAAKDANAVQLLDTYFRLNDVNKKMALGAIRALLQSEETPIE